MGLDEIVKAVISAAVAVIVPSAIKQFWPEPEPSDSAPVFTWAVAGFIGGALGGLVSGAMGPVGAGIGNWAAFGAAIGLMQWFALRGYRAVGVWFVFASTLGWTLFTLAGGLGGAWGWIIAGGAVGILQSLSLGQGKGAFWWIVVNPLAWLIAGWAGVIVGMPLVQVNPVLGWIVGWGVVGLVGAIVLIAPLTQLQARGNPLGQPA